MEDDVEQGGVERLMVVWWAKLCVILSFLPGLGTTVLVFGGYGYLDNGKHLLSNCCCFAVRDLFARFVVKERLETGCISAGGLLQKVGDCSRGTLCT